MPEIEFLEQNKSSSKILEKKIMIIVFCLSLFLIVVGCLCAISEASRPTTWGILLGLSFAWFSFFIVWLFLIYDSKLKLKISVFAGIVLWLVRLFLLLVLLLVIVFAFIINYSYSTSYILQILLSALIAYSISMFTVFIFGIEEIIFNYKHKKNII